VAHRWLADSGAVIVVHDQEQEQQVRTAIDRLRTETGAAEPRILQGAAAYEERLGRRREWQQSAGITLGQLVEPGVIERAYVLAPPASAAGRAYGDMTRALSVAAEAHLVSHQPDAWTAAQAGIEAKRIRDGMASQARAENVCQVAAAAEIREAGRRREQDAERSHDRAVGHDAAGV